MQSDGQTIGAGYSYKEIVQHTTERILQTITIHPTQYPLEIEIADGLDGSGSHRIYNQLSDNPNFTTKNFLLLLSKFFRLRTLARLQYGTTLFLISFFHSTHHFVSQV